MTSIQERLSTANPAAPVAKRMPARERIPMSVPRQRLSVPEIPGYHLHWMLGKPDRIEQALNAGYSFVGKEEVDLNRTGIADDPNGSGHEGIGSQVSVVTGMDAQNREVQRLFLMKIPLELWEEDQKALAERNESVAAAIRGDKGLLDPKGGNDHRYVPPGAANRHLFIPKR